MRRMIKSALRRFGLWPVVGLVTLLSVAVSLAIAAAVHAFVLHVAMPPAAWALSVGCPLLLAPTMSVGSFSLLLRLDLAHEQLRHLSETDHLTGAHNRRYVMERLRAAAEALHAGAAGPFALALIDVDNFKQVNDHHGHLAGDEVLRRLASACRERLRPGDTFARFGGEEFALLMPSTPLEEAAALLERLREQVAALAIDWPEGRLAVTVSIGVASPLLAAPDAGAQMQAMLRRADEALYRAKREGKNRVALPPLAEAA
jgi:diguanylate cyclase (GGDEF)-like protein